MQSLLQSNKVKILAGIIKLKPGANITLYSKGKIDRHPYIICMKPLTHQSDKLSVSDANGKLSVATQNCVITDIRNAKQLHKSVKSCQLLDTRTVVSVGDIGLPGYAYFTIQEALE
jgi:hypothetical protein